ncbi:MAG TPA: AAA family ATPase [Gaiellaceae bacterium]
MQPLVGRDKEMERLKALVQSARNGKSDALLLRGEPGVGKSALLRYAAELAEGMAVLEVRGLEVESQLAFVGLTDLLGPVVEHLGELPQPQAEALAGALGRGPPARGDRFVVCVATLGLLAVAAEHVPVLAVVDDVHWLDEASKEALFFAARRLEAERVGLVMAGLEPEPALVTHAGADEVTLAGLGRVPAAKLLEQRVPHPIAPEVIDQLVQATGGNPLALLDLVASLNEGQLRGTERLGEPLPPAVGVERAFLRQVDRLGAEAGEALLVVATSSGSTSAITTACELLGLPPDALEPAERAGVITHTDGRTRFSHPLLRAAVHNSATTGARARVHTALAEALAGNPDDQHLESGWPGRATERRAWHLAAAAHGPDESVAATLEAAAALARARGGYEASATALERAAKLTPGDDERVRRLVDAGRDWQLAGRPAAALELLQEALASTSDDRQRAQIQHLRAQIRMTQGEFAAVHSLLRGEAARIAPLDEAQATLMLADAAVGASAAGEIGTALGYACEAQALGTRSGGTAELAGDMIYGGLLVASGEAERGAPLVLRHAPLPEGHDAPPFVLQIMPTVLVVLGEYDRARIFLDWLTRSARALSSPSLLALALQLRADLAYRTGDWLAAYADAAEGHRLARETNGNVVHSLAYLAQVEAARGLEGDCRKHVAELLERSTRLKFGAGLTYSHAFIGRLALGLGLIGEAIAELEQAADLIERHGMREPNWVQAAPDLIEAYARAGRTGEAAAALSDLQEQAKKTARVWTLAAAARCSGLLAAEHSFEQEFQHALAAHARTTTPFERARTELCFGERLRRAHRPTDARAHLRSALAAFDRLDAAPWLARTRSELATIGENAQPRNGGRLSSLTPHELQLALIVSRGATNKEAGAALFISPKTVEAHLHHTYVKLGIRSRTELAHLVALDQMLPEARPRL